MNRMSKVVVAVLVTLVISSPIAISAPAQKAPPKPPDNSAAYNAYLGRLRAKILDKWMMADGKNHVVLTANVNQDGSVADMSVVSTPTCTPAEQAASDAFNQSQPLESLPGNMGAKLTLTFDSTVDPHGDSTSNLGCRLDPQAKKAE
jgi:hypothetical protein